MEIVKSCGEAAPNSRGVPRRRRRRNAFGLIQEYCTRIESSVELSDNLIIKMKKFGLVSLIGLFSVFIVPAQVVPSGVVISVPNVAVNKSSALEPLEPGTLERIVFIHYANGKIVASAKTPSAMIHLRLLTFTTSPAEFQISDFRFQIKT